MLKTQNVREEDVNNHLAEFNYTQKDILEKLNKTLSFYLKIESGNRNPRLSLSKYFLMKV